MAREETVLEESVILHHTGTADKKKIIDAVLSAVGIQTMAPNIEKTEITAYPVTLSGGQAPDAVLLVLKFDQKNTIVVVYRKAADGYHFWGMVGRFYEIRKVEFVSEPDSRATVILLTEYVNMKLGAYEENVFLKGYYWDGIAFARVLNIATNIKAYWNKAWLAEEEGKTWERVTLDSELQWRNNGTLLVRQFETQDYSISSQKDSIPLPKDNTFMSIRSRFGVEAYYWHKRWKRFILYEGTYKKTNEKIAVLQDISQSPYSLVEGPIEKSIILTDGQETLIVGQDEIIL